MWLRRRVRFIGLLVAASLIVPFLAFSSPAASIQAQGGEDPAALPEETVQTIHEVRAATFPYHDLDTAEEAGYGKFLDCFTYGETRGMGQHYVNGELVGDDVLDPLQPEALVYEPQADGTPVLVAFEYLVFADAWDPDNTGREAPTLFGQDFALKTNIPETPPVWALHIWLWSHNPEGLFADFNPLITCPADQPIVDMSMMPAATPAP